MTARTLGATALRIVGIYLFVQVLAYVPGVVGLVGRVRELDLLGNATFYVVVTAVPPLILLICGTLLFWQSDALGKRLFPRDGTLERVDRRDVEAIAFAVAGLWVFGCSIPGLMDDAGSMVSELNKIGEAGHVDIPWRSAVAHGVQAIVGLVLFLQAGSIARWWDRRVIGGQMGEARHDA